MLERLDSLPTGWIILACALVAGVLVLATTIRAVGVWLRLRRTLPVAEDLVATHLAALDDRTRDALGAVAAFDADSGSGSGPPEDVPPAPAGLDPARLSQLRDALGALRQSMTELRFLISEPARARRHLLRTIVDLVLPTGLDDGGEHRGAGGSRPNRARNADRQPGGIGA